MKHSITILITATFLPLLVGCSGQSSLSSQSADIIANLSPNMQGLAENTQEDEAGIAFVNNSNDRMYIDDWRRALYLDKPSGLSPYAVIQD